MARGRKPALPLEEQLQVLINNISETEDSLKEMKKKKVELEERIKANQLAELNDLILSSGKTLEEVKQLISASDVSDNEEE